MKAYTDGSTEKNLLKTYWKSWEIMQIQPLQSPNLKSVRRFGTVWLDLCKTSLSTTISIRPIDIFKCIKWCPWMSLCFFFCCAQGSLFTKKTYTDFIKLFRPKVIFILVWNDPTFQTPLITINPSLQDEAAAWLFSMQLR